MAINRRTVLYFGFFIFLFGCESEKIAEVSSPPVTMGYIKKVEDGDTVLAEVEDRIIQIRLQGIDCPEIEGKYISKTQPYGPEAKVFLKKLLEKKWVQIQGEEKDRHNRLLATILMDNKDANLKMIAVGLAEVYPGFSQPEYLEAEKAARAQHLGLWSSPERISPREWRKRYKIGQQP